MTNTMTPERQRVALAEWECWRNIKQEQNALSTIHPGFAEVWRSDYMGSRDGLRTAIPDFLHDLNAVARIEAKLTEKRRYAQTLMDVCQNHPVGCIPDWQEDLLKLYYVVTATAPQRCEALLRTLGLWEESPRDEGVVVDAHQ